MLESIVKFFAKFRITKNIDDVSSMERIGRDEYKYVEGDRALTVQIEMLSGTPKRVIYSRTIKNWMPPYENEIITEDKRKQIVAKICKYFEMNNISYTVE
jgi:immunity protein 74 of polymorphic toxin system